MYETAAVLAAVVLIYSVIAGRVGKSWLSGPILFVAAGFMLGPAASNLLELDITGAELRLMAEISLAMVLFSDAAHADLTVVRRFVGLPERLLMIGLPLTIALGLVLGLWIFPALGVLEVALLAALLAPTDAALGTPVVANAAVPSKIREALNLESGLNDGICVPVVIILLDLAIGTEIHGGTASHAVVVVVEEIGIGLLVGLGLTAAAAALLRFAAGLGWITEEWRHIPAIALAALCFMTAQALGGSGFIACFVGGLLFGFLAKHHRAELLGSVASAGEVMSLFTWLVFGGPVLAMLLHKVTLSIVLYAVLSLTVVRMAPVYLALAGAGMRAGDKLFVGWFGPRGLASIVFAIIVFDAGLPGRDTVAVTAVCTILLSVIAHGITANPLVASFRRAEAGKMAD
jgi:NhaP-type Na+/H+ or K+/H+ antiporter